MKVVYRTENTLIIREGEYFLTNLTKSESWKILKQHHDAELLAELKEKTGYEHVELDVLKQLADCAERSIAAAWGRYVELITDGEWRDYQISDYHFSPTYFRKALAKRRGWKKRCGENLISYWLLYNRRIYRTGYYIRH